VLSDEERRRIRAEEIFRDEIRRELAAHDSRRSRLWAFTNSSIFIWFLSSVVVAAITTGYSRCSEATRVSAASEETKRRLNVELSRRAAELEAELAAVAAAPEVAKDERFREALNTVRRAHTPIFTEFSDRPLSSILWEREQVERIAAVKPCREAFDVAARLEVNGPSLTGPINLPHEIAVARTLCSNVRGCAALRHAA